MASTPETNMKLLEEKLRENCCIGDVAKVKILLKKGVNINAANRMNGWTPLHWAAKRGHKSLVELLLKEGAEKNCKTKKGETPYALASKDDVKELLCNSEEGEDVEQEIMSEDLPIIPNYIKNPPFVYMNNDDNDSEISENLPFGLGRNLKSDDDTVIMSPVKRNRGSLVSPPRKTLALDVSGKLNGIQAVNNISELVLKVRVASSDEEDFIEIEIDYDKLTFENLMDICCKELEIERDSVRKVRKLPNTIVRKDKDVGRLQQFQEIEIVQH